ncbi:MAG: sacsin N-terminal ATP-binding-like domain-containing protein [Roseburia sp.]
MNNFSADISELGVVQSASKIWEKISILRNLDEREKRKYSRRWIWELLQNAKDVSIDSVNVKIDYFQKQIIFSHDGKKFTCKDLLSLVTQTSFKEMEQEQATGKFGTGFITTHLICEKIRLN